jgi:ribosome biogenesis protein MAK21
LKIVLKQKENCMADETEETKYYDMAKREPLYAGADTTLLWEVTAFVNHYHPTVRKFAAHIING